MTLQVARADPVVQVIRKGQAVPEDGVFYSSDAHAQLVAKLKGMEAKCQELTDHAVKVETVRLTLELNKWKLEADSWKRQFQLAEDFGLKQRNLLLKQVAESQQVPWYQRPWFIASLTVGLTVGLAAFSVWTFKELAEKR